MLDDTVLCQILTAIVEVQTQQMMQHLSDLEWLNFGEPMPMVASVSWLTDVAPVCFSAAVVHLLHVSTSKCE